MAPGDGARQDGRPSLQHLHPPLAGGGQEDAGQQEIVLEADHEEGDLSEVVDDEGEPLK